jgi:uncharacterized RDD family membrane protein YckC
VGDDARRAADTGSTVERAPSGPAAPSTRAADVVVGVAATGARIGAGAGRLVLLPGRLFVRSPLVAPVMRAGARRLASAGRDAEAAGGQRLEAAAGRIVDSRVTARAVDRALSGPLPQALSEETIEQLARRVIDSPSFERILREAARSRTAQDLVEEALHSPQLQVAVEEVLTGPAVRNVLGRETRTLWDDVTASVRRAAARVDDALERGARRLTGRRPHATAEVEARAGYAGLASRTVGFLADLAITQFAALVVGALVGLVGWLLGIDPPEWLVGVLAGAGWTVAVGGYFVFFWTTAGRTPGMHLPGLRVTDRDGGPLRARRSVLRLVGTVLALAPLGAGLVPVLFDGRRRALQDYLARTVVVRDA